MSQKTIEEEEIEHTCKIPIGTKGMGAVGAGSEEVEESEEEGEEDKLVSLVVSVGATVFAAVVDLLSCWLRACS